MNFATAVVLVLLIALVVLAVRYIVKNGSCYDCPSKGKCAGHCSTDIKKDKDYSKKVAMIDEIIQNHNQKIVSKE